MNVAVVGKGRNCPAEVSRLAFDVGRSIGERGHHLLVGALGGVMDAAAQGFAAADGSGVAIGLAPAEADRSTEPSNHLDVFLDTGLTAPTRNVVVGSAADAMIVCPGSHGTLQEATVALDHTERVVMVGDHEGYLTLMLRSAIPWVEDVEDVWVTLGR